MAELENGATVAVKSGHTGDVWVGVRPEHLVMDAEGPLHVEVKLVEPLGANTLLHGSLNGSDTTFAASLPGIHKSPHAHAVMAFRAERDHIHIFDRETGQRLD